MKFGQTASACGKMNWAKKTEQVDVDILIS
jgi:hypothetical protein